MSAKTPKNPPFVCGKKPDGSYEFGESFHVALALKCDPDAQAFVNDFPQCSRFLKDLGLGEQLVFEMPEQARKTEDNPQIIKTAFDSGSLDDHRNSIRIKIDTQAEKEDWNIHFKPLLSPPTLESQQTVLIWLREAAGYCPFRNLSERGLQQLIRVCQSLKLNPILVSGTNSSLGVSDVRPRLHAFYTHPFFDDESVAKQLWFLNRFIKQNKTIASIGMMSGAMDGLAFFLNHPVVYFETQRQRLNKQGEEEKSRMEKVSEAITELQRIELKKTIDTKNPFHKFCFRDLLRIRRKLSEISKNATSGKP